MADDRLVCVSTPGYGRSWVKERFLSGAQLAAVIEQEVEKDKELLRMMGRRYTPKQLKMLDDSRPMKIYGGARRLK